MPSSSRSVTVACAGCGTVAMSWSPPPGSYGRPSSTIPCLMSETTSSGLASPSRSISSTLDTPGVGGAAGGVRSRRVKRTRVSTAGHASGAASACEARAS